MGKKVKNNPMLSMIDPLGLFTDDPTRVNIPGANQQLQSIFRGWAGLIAPGQNGLGAASNMLSSAALQSIQLANTLGPRMVAAQARLANLDPLTSRARGNARSALTTQGSALSMLRQAIRNPNQADPTVQRMVRNSVRDSFAARGTMFGGPAAIKEGTALANVNLNAQSRRISDLLGAIGGLGGAAAPGLSTSLPTQLSSFSPLSLLGAPGGAMTGAASTALSLPAQGMMFNAQGALQQQQALMQGAGTLAGMFI